MEGINGDIERLPENCISHVLSLTSPRDSCRASLISTTFRSAAESDTVWERFLPSDYRDILSQAVDPVRFSSKKKLYFRLCDSVLIDGGNVSFALEKSSGKKCFLMSARELSIIWGYTPRYWRWISLSDSRFAEGAELLAVCWLEIQGSIDARVLSPKTTYSAYLVFRAVHGSYGLSFPPQETSVKVGAHVSKHRVCVQPYGGEMRQPHLVISGRSVLFRSLPREAEETDRLLRAPHAREDGWMELEMGEFFIDEGEEGEVYMSLTEVKGGHWKRGLIVQGIGVRPKK